MNGGRDGRCQNGLQLGQRAVEFVRKGGFDPCEGFRKIFMLLCLFQRLRGRWGPLRNTAPALQGFALSVQAAPTRLCGGLENAAGWAYLLLKVSQIE